MMITVWDMASSALLSRKRKQVATEPAVATREADDYEKRLMARLIQRIYRLSNDHGTDLILLDVPQQGGPGDFRSSIPIDLLEEFERNSDALIWSEEVLSPYRHLAEFHAPHGQQSISELSHMLLGVAVAQRIERVGRDSPPKWPSKALDRARAHGDQSALEEPLC